MKFLNGVLFGHLFILWEKKSKINLKLSIVITTKNRKSALRECVKSILESNIKNFELIIIDDNSSDGTENLSSKDFNFSELKIYHQKSSLKMAQARNLGAKISCGDYILFIDDDNTIVKNMIKELIDCADKNIRYGILGPRMFYKKDMKEYMSFQKINLYTGKTTGYISSDSKEINDSDGIPNVFLVKREVFEKCGYFDNELMQSYTEADFAFRARKLGYKCGICTKAITYHSISKSDNVTSRGLGGNFPLKAYCLIRNRIIFIFRYATNFQKIIFVLFFSWLYPLIYSFLILGDKHFNLIKLYWLGFYDGLAYILTKKIKYSLKDQDI